MAPIMRTDASRVDPYKIFLQFKVVVHECIILALPPTPAMPTLLQYYCTTIVQYTPPPPPTALLYAILHTILGLAISCKGQLTALGEPDIYRLQLYLSTLFDGIYYIYAYIYL